jgi:O-antigen/teichoic acid export membrane protein
MSMKRQSLWNMLPLLATSVVGFLTTPLIYRNLGGEGGYAFFQAVQIFGASFGFMDLGFGLAVGRYIGVALGRGDRDAVRQYWATGNALALPLLAVMAFVFVGVGVFFGPRWFGFVHSEEDRRLLQWCFAACGLGMFLSFYTQFWNLVSQAHLDYKFISALKTAANLGQIGMTLLVSWLTHNPALVLIWCTAVSLLQLAIFVWHSRRTYGLGFNFREASLLRLREMAMFSGKTLAGCVVGSLLGRVDQALVGKLSPGLDFSNFSAATNATNRLTNLSLAAVGPVYYHSARAVGSGERSLSRIFDEMFSIVLGWYCFAATWLVVWSPLLLALWWGRTPAGGTTVAHLLEPYFPVLCVAFSLSAVSCVSGAQFGPLNRVGTEVYFTIASALATAAGVFIGWRLNGLVGVAYGLVASRVVCVFQDLYVARMVGAKGWLSLTNWRRILIQVAVAFGFLALRWNLPLSTWASLGFALLHAGLIGTWLAWPYYRNWRQRRLQPDPSMVSSEH